MVARVGVRVGLIPVVVLLLRWAAPDPVALAGALGDPVGRVRQDGLDAVVAEATGALGWLVLLWAGAAALFVGAARLPGAAGRAAEVVAGRALPAGMRRLVTVALGLTLTATTSEAAFAATPGPATTAPQAAARTSDRPGGSPVDWPLDGSKGEPSPPGVDWPLETGPPPPEAGDRPRDPTDERARPRVAGAQPERLVVVSAGDTLWSIAARRLGPGASAAEIAAGWPRWYEANRAEIGPDPSHLRAGLLLRVPGAP